MKDSGGKQAMSFPRYGKLFRDFSTLWKIPRMRDHTVENVALVAWTSRSAHLPVLLHGFFCSARTRGPRYGEPLPLSVVDIRLFALFPTGRAQRAHLQKKPFALVFRSSSQQNHMFPSLPSYSCPLASIRGCFPSLPPLRFSVSPTD